MPQRKRRYVGSTIKGNIHSRPEEEKGAEENHRLLSAGCRPPPGRGAVRRGAGRAVRRGRGRELKWWRRRGGGGSGVGKRGWLLVFGAGGGSHSCSRHHQAAGRDAPADRRIGSRAGGDAPPVARAPGRVFASVSMWEKEEEEEEEAAICLLGWSPPGSTCSPH